MLVASTDLNIIYKVDDTGNVSLNKHSVVNEAESILN